MNKFEEFLKKVSSDTEFNTKFQSIFTNDAIEDKKAAIIQLGEELGVNFTEEDMKAYAESVKANASCEGELSDEQLETVAGGGFWDDFAYGFCSVLETLGFCFING